MKENIKYQIKSKNLHTLTVVHKDFSKLHQSLLFNAAIDSKVIKEINQLCFLFNIINFNIEREDKKIISISYTIDQRNEFENLKEKDKQFWQLTTFYKILNV